MLILAVWQVVALGLVLAAAVTLLGIWWRQQSRHWWSVLIASLAAAPALSWWSGIVFQVDDYRAGCDGLCLGSSGAPIPFYRGEAAGGELSLAGFLLNALVYLALLLVWAALTRVVVRRVDENSGRAWAVKGMLGALLFGVPLAFSPLLLPPPEAHMRGDTQRIAINARREVYLYDQLADFPVLRVGLNDVRPRLDGQTGMRVCLRTYTFFYLPTGLMFLDMTPEGLHSNNGGVLPRTGSCWE